MLHGMGSIRLVNNQMTLHLDRQQTGQQKMDGNEEESGSIDGSFLHHSCFIPFAFILPH